MKVFLNGRMVDERVARVSVFDHGFLYGDGIYETVRAYGYRVFRWEDHYRRLLQSARRLQLRCPASSRSLRRSIETLLRANRKPDAAVRITLARGPGPLGLDPKVCPQPTLALMLHPDRHVEALRETGASIVVPWVRRNHPRCLDPQIKANNSLNTIFAKMEAQRYKTFEAVLLNLDGELTEGTTCNIFLVKAGRVATPALSCGLLEGVTRGVVLRIARQAGVPIRESSLRIADLRRADEVFLTSTTLEILPVTSVKEAGPRGILRRYRIGSGRPGPLTQALFHRLQTWLARETGALRHPVV